VKYDESNTTNINQERQKLNKYTKLLQPYYTKLHMNSSQI